MRYGKLNTDELKELVLGHIKKTRQEVKLSASLGEDCAVLGFDGYMLLSSDPITASMPDGELGSLAVDVACNDIASNGGEPVALMVTLIVPPDCDKSRIGDIMTSVQSRASVINVDIIGGHTEFSDCVTRPIVSCTAIGKSLKIIQKQDIRVGDNIYMTKSAGIEGTVILYNELSKSSPLVSVSNDKIIKKYKNMLSVVPEGRIMSDITGISSMHDITEGGVLGAISEICLGLGFGAEVYSESIRVDMLTKNICAEFNIDPFKLISSGSMLFTFNGNDSDLSLLSKAGVDYSLIGRITGGKKVVLMEDNKTKAVSVETDELWQKMCKNSKK